jgi:hypothetical protein
MNKIADGRVDVAGDHKTESDTYGSGEEVNRYEIEAHYKNTVG